MPRAQSDDPSAWRNFPKPPRKRRPVGRPRKNDVLTVFYGYPVEVIAAWCCVALSTAHAWKSGRLKPSKAAAELFRLHKERLVLTPEWQREGWIIKPDAIVDPEGVETSRGLLRGYALILAWAHDLAQRSGDERDIERYWELLKAA